MPTNRRIAYHVNISSAALALITAVTTTSAVMALPAQAAPQRIHRAAASASTGWRVFDTISIKNQIVVMTRIVAVSGDDAWALGLTGKTPSALARGLIEHWNGKAWRQTQPPAKLLARFRTSADVFFFIGASSARNAWVFTDEGKYLWFDGNRWIYGQVPRLKSKILITTSVKVFSPTDVWAFGCRARSSLSAIENGCAPAAARFNGRHWVPVRLPGKGLIGEVSALAPDDMWAAEDPSISGAVNPRIHILHWNGTTWRIAPSQPRLPATTLLGAIAARSDSDIWIGGNVPEPTKSVGHPVERQLVWHWNGRSWTNVSPPSRPSDGNSVADLVLDGTGGVFELVRHIVGNGRTITSPIRHYTGGRWQGPSSIGRLIAHLAQVPGTTSIWGVGVTAKHRRGLIILHGPRPR
ncbi:MAG TPA: hypothetical protein VFI65_21310 [Streptosporangiaceae bacterium]|nr:hypothetical protein [Streptosporangiaceae bacterium]